VRAQVSNRPVLEQKASVNVWQQIGAEEPAAAAQQLMKQNDNFGYKARPQMLAEKTNNVNVWQQIGATEPKVAAQQLMTQNDNFGYKAPTQMLFQKRMKKHLAPGAKMAKVSPPPPPPFPSLGTCMFDSITHSQTYTCTYTYLDVLKHKHAHAQKHKHAHAVNTWGVLKHKHTHTMNVTMKRKRTEQRVGFHRCPHP